MGTENDSLKSIECLYRGKRETDIATAGESIVAYHRWIESPDGGTWQTSKILKEIRDYNRDDCVSTWELAQWLRGIQAYCGIKYVPPTLSRKAEDLKTMPRSRKDSSIQFPWTDLPIPTDGA